MNISERIKNILLKPKEEWQIIAAEATSIAELYRNYIFILAAIGPVASFIGMSLVGVSLPVGGTFRVSIARGLASAVVHYGLALAAVYLLAMIIDALAPLFPGKRILARPSSWPCTPLSQDGWPVFLPSSLPWESSGSWGCTGSISSTSGCRFS